jgi:hypothetical protein
MEFIGMNKNQALIDLQNRVRKVLSEEGAFSPFKISAATLMELLNEIEYWRNKEREKKVRKTKTLISS